jgi:hypothetical protein
VKFLLLLPLFASKALWAQAFEIPISASLQPNRTFTAAKRLDWVLDSTVGPTTLLTVAIGSGLTTWSNSPEEYGSHWNGYGKRAASNLGTALVSNSLEASLGALWGEDARYRRSGERSTGARIKYAIKMAFLAEKRDGGRMPAYARFVAIPSACVISNSWRETSERTAGETMARISIGFANRIGGNAFVEFWPDVRNRLTRRSPAADSSGTGRP